MKKISAYVNGVKVQYLVEELEALGARKVKATVYSSGSPSISYMQLLCDDNKVEEVRSVIHRIGATGTACDHCLRVTDFDTGIPRVLS